MELIPVMSQSEVDGIDSRETYQASKLKTLIDWVEEKDRLNEVGFHTYKNNNGNKKKYCIQYHSYPFPICNRANNIPICLKGTWCFKYRDR